MHHRGCRKPQMPPKMVITNEFAQSTHKPNTTNENAFARLLGKNWPQEATRNAQRHAINTASRYPSYRFFISFGISSTISGYSKGTWAFFHSPVGVRGKARGVVPRWKVSCPHDRAHAGAIGPVWRKPPSSAHGSRVVGFLGNKVQADRAVYRQLVDPVLSVGESSCVGADCGPRREVSKAHVNRKVIPLASLSSLRWRNFQDSPRR